MHSSTLLTQHSMTAAKLNEPKYPNVSRNARSLPLHGSSGVEVYLFFFIKLRAKISAFVIKRVQRPVWLLIIGCAFTSHFLFTSYAIVFPCAMHRRSVSAYEWSDDCARGWHTLLQSCNKTIPHKSSSHTPHYTPFGTTTPANLAPPYNIHDSAERRKPMMIAPLQKLAQVYRCATSWLALFQASK